MPAKSRKALENILRKDFSKEVTEEILGMMDRLGKGKTDIAEIEKKVTQYILDHVKKDVKAAIAIGENLYWQWPIVPPSTPKRIK